jgi:hypothetical protein
MQHNTKNLSTNVSSNKYVPEISPGMKEFSIVGNAAAQVGKKLGNSSLWEWIERGFGWLFGGGASTAGIDARTFSSSGNVASLTKDSFAKKSGGGLSGFIKNMFKDGESMMGWGSFITGIGNAVSAFTDRTDEFKERELDIYESLGKEGLEINRMKAEDAIRQTALSSMFMGHTNPIAMVKGVKDPGPGVVVRPAQGEVSQSTGGIISGSSPGLLKQKTQGVLA